ncbi:MAG: hypothetical protein IAE89_07110 [Anaerolineae bacterium]|nr:hypothetical protein [Anaerolineae bacterium]
MGSFLPILLFIVFALVLLLGYIGMRRKFMRTGSIIVYMLIGSIATMFLVSLTNGNNILQAAFVGIVVGGAFSVITASTAWYFQRAEARKLPPDQPENTTIE